MGRRPQSLAPSAVIAAVIVAFFDNAPWNNLLRVRFRLFYVGGSFSALTLAEPEGEEDGDRNSEDGNDGDGSFDGR